MQQFSCTCGQPLFFDSTVCEGCDRLVGFIPTWQIVRPLNDSDRRCGNWVNHDACNWVVESDQDTLCPSCQLTEVTPALTSEDNLKRWIRLELAKRRLVYSLLGFKLPILNKDKDPERGLAFHFKEDRFSNPGVADDQVITGHADGLITININEADPVERVIARVNMNEQYRTLLGHMRHEIGHYYWDRLIRDTDLLQDFRQLFGNEQQDYSASLQAYYDAGKITGWQDAYVSAYASAHPWEDWAETWAHVLHMTDTLETARAHQIIPGITGQPLDDQDPDREISAWMELSVILNELNRSMGTQDSYPFVLSPPVVEKLRFIFRVIAQSASGQDQAEA